MTQAEAAGASAGGGPVDARQASRGATSWSPSVFTGGEPGEAEAHRQFARRVGADYARWLAGWVDELDDWSPEWHDAWELSDLHMRLTPAQLKALTAELLETIMRYRAAGPDGEDAERVAVLLQAFPQRGPLP